MALSGVILGIFQMFGVAVTNQIGLTEGLCKAAVQHSQFSLSFNTWIDTWVVLRFLHTEMQKINPTTLHILFAINYDSVCPGAARCLESFIKTI